MKKKSDDNVVSLFQANRRSSVRLREDAQALVRDAFEADDLSLRVQLARKALDVFPDCADALTILADHELKPEKAVVVYEKAVVAAKRLLGKQAFTTFSGRFWLAAETRPYMRAIHGLARSLRVLGRLSEAAERFQEMLRLNPNDNQGVRDELLPLLMELGRDEDAARLVRVYCEDGLATMTYCRALLEFRQSGDSAEARFALERAFESNGLVPLFLAGRKNLPVTLPSSFRAGDSSEAVLAVVDMFSAWKLTPGALEWLATHEAVRSTAT